MDLVEVRSNQSSNIVTINWAINNVCNYKCWYCFPGSNHGTFGNPDLDLSIKNFDHLFQQYEKKLKKDRFDFVITGGEPTLWKDLVPFITHLRNTYKEKIKITIASNLSRTLRWWDEHYQLFDYIVGSYHINEGDLEKYIKIADHLSSKGAPFFAFMLMDSRVWDKCINAMEIMKKSKYPWLIYPKKLECLTPEDEYTPEQLNYFLNNLFARRPQNEMDRLCGHMTSVAVTSLGEEIDALGTFYTVENLNSFTGWECSIGLEFISIRWNGEIHGNCGTPLFGKNFKFNIRDEKFVEKFNVDMGAKVMCNIKVCECTPETHVTKRKMS